MFAPFTLVARDQEGRLSRQDDPLVHWAHVDTGSMVNIVYQGVLDAFPALRAYSREFTHVVKGIGNVQQRVTCKLVDVPISLGSDQAPGSCTLATFYVLDAPSYHWLLGLTFLEPIQGEVLCAPRILRYKLGRAGQHA